MPENYAQDTYWEARYIRSYSEKILFNDYYRKIGLEPPAVRRRTDQTQKGRASMRGASF